MTRKDFRMLAESVKLIPDPDLRSQVGMMIGHNCLLSNPRFSWDKWNKACNTDIEESEV